MRKRERERMCSLAQLSRFAAFFLHLIKYALPEQQEPISRSFFSPFIVFYIESVAFYFVIRTSFAKTKTHPNELYIHLYIHTHIHPDISVRCVCSFSRFPMCFIKVTPNISQKLIERLPIGNKEQNVKPFQKTVQNDSKSVDFLWANTQ